MSIRKGKARCDQRWLADIGRRLRGKRHEMGLTLRDVCGKVGMSNPMLCNMEQGKTSFGVEILTALAELYGVSTDWILGVSKF